MTIKLQWMRQQIYDIGECCPEWWSFIRQNKIDLGAVEPHCGIVAVALCKSHNTVDGKRLFEFSQNGIPCAVIEAICFRREDGNLNPYTADLVAWPLHAPNSIATALGAGEGCELLGAWSACRTDHSPLAIHRTPLAWLQAGCEGCVVLKETESGYWLNKAGGPFICEDAEHAHQVSQLLGRNAVAHDIFIPETWRAA